MNRTIRVTVLSGFMLTALQAAAAAGEIHRAIDRVPGAYIIELEPGTPAPANADALTRRAGAKLGHVYDVVMNGFSIRGTEQQAVALTRMPGVASVSEVGRFHPTDVMSHAPVGLDRIDQRARPLDTFYTYTMYTAPTNVYIMDTGVDPYPDFGNRLVTNVNFSRNASGVVDPNDTTDHGLPLGDGYHGTMVAVIAAGGQHGIARWAKIHNVRVCSLSCDGDDMLAGVNWITQQRNARPSEIHVANASIAGGDTRPNNAFIASINAGVAWVFGAGNNSEDACAYHPASLAATRSGAISVGASIPETDAIATYSNQGPCVEIYAPGSTTWGFPPAPSSRADGTSVAAPHVTGVFAARWANSPTSTAAEIEGLIKGVGTAGVLTNIWPTSTNLLLYSLLPKRRAVDH